MHVGMNAMEAGLIAFIRSLPVGVQWRVSYCFIDKGISTLDSVRFISEEALWTFPDLGPRSIACILKARSRLHDGISDRQFIDSEVT
jgi:hypothetical protein